MRICRWLLTDALSRVGIWSGEEAAVENEVVAGHEGSLAGTHPQNRFGDFERFAKAPDGMVRENRFVGRGIAKRTFGHRCFDHRGADGIDTDALEGRFERCGS